MPPRKSTSSRTKKSANLSQPILSFQSRKPLPDRKLTKSSSLKPSASDSSIPLSPSEEVHEIHLGKPDAVPAEKKTGERRQLDVKSKEWDGMRRLVKKEMGGMKPIHAGPDTHDDVHRLSSCRLFVSMKLTPSHFPCYSCEPIPTVTVYRSTVDIYPPLDLSDILRIFDMTSRYGPSVGITRLERWERAKKWGLNPPEEIHTILTTEQGEDMPAYRENVLYSWLG